MTGLAVDIEVPGRVRAAFTAERGHVVAVIGPNGAGKSSLLHAIAGLTRHTGEVRLDGESWNDPTLPVPGRPIGVVFQDQALFPHLTALANVAFGLRCRDRSRREADVIAREWLDRLRVAGLADRRPSELSGGQAQRVALARALATEPALLLLDEPFGGLDIGVATTLRLDLAGHLEAYDGVTLLVTHDPIDALTLADRLLVLDDGAVAQYGIPAEVAAQPRTEHVAQLAGLNVLRERRGMAVFRPTSVVVSLARPEGSSRHRWQGRVLGVSAHGDAVRLVVGTEPRLLADVTPAAAAELELAPGRQVWLAVKETAMTWYAEA
jgi:molybdate transport system ATP-binding protein